MLPFLIWMYEMKMSFQSDLCMISFSIPFFFFLLLIVWLPPYCCNMLPLWSRSRGGVPCGCQFMKQEEVLRGQGASFKDFHLLFSLYRCLNNNKHWCCCVVNMLVFFLTFLFQDLFCPLILFTHNPQVPWRGTLRSITCWDAEMLHFAPMFAHICLHSPATTERKKQIQLLSGCVCLRSPD